MAKQKFETKKLGEIILEVTTQPDGQTLIDSWSLNQLAHSEDMRKLGFEVVDYDFPYINAGSATCILKCRDKDGMLPMAIGEANKGNLTNDLSKNLPHTMAYKRALDRAIIEYLGIGDGDRKRLYSDTEIERIGDTIIPVEEIPYLETELPEIPEEVTTVSEEVVEETIEEVIEETETPVTTEAEETKENLLAYEIKAGVHKGKSIADLLEGKTIKEVCEVQKHYVPWLINNEPKREELIELKEKLIKLQEMEENNG